MKDFSPTSVVATWRDRIKKSGKTEESAARESGLDKGQLSRILNNKGLPSLKAFEDFENYLRRIGV